MMKNSEKGLTLIELMITTVVVVLVLVGFMGTNTAITQASETAFERSVAMQDANQVIEMMRNTAQTGDFPDNVTAVYPNNGTVAGFSNLTGQTVTVAYANPAADPLNVTVTVGWQEQGRRAVTTQLRTLITQRS